MSEKENRKRRTGRTKYYSWKLTAVLAVLLAFLISILWSLFISGPARVHEEEIARTQAAIKAQVPEIEGLDQTDFAYQTWQGYTSDTLYWFDASGQIITTRGMQTLNYNEAREKAASNYGLDAATVQLAYGYSEPVYLLQNDSLILMLDYDSLEWVYERNTDE